MTYSISAARELTADYFMQNRVMGKVPAVTADRMSARIEHAQLTSCTIELYKNGDGFTPCMFFTAYPDGRFVVEQVLPVPADDLPLLLAHYTHKHVMSDCEDMAREYRDNYQGFFDVDVTRHGIKVYADDVTEID